MMLRRLQRLFMGNRKTLLAIAPGAIACTHEQLYRVQDRNVSRFSLESDGLNVYLKNNTILFLPKSEFRPGYALSRGETPDRLHPPENACPGCDGCNKFEDCVKK